MSERITVGTTTLWRLLLGYVRYAMGRMSTAPLEAQSYIYEFSRIFTDRQLKQLRDEIETELREMEQMGSTLGASIDHETWKVTVAGIDRILSETSLK